MYNGNWWYRYTDGSYPISKFDTINGATYYLQSDGTMATNTWIGNYYVGSDGCYRG